MLRFVRRDRHSERETEMKEERRNKERKMEVNTEQIEGDRKTKKFMRGEKKRKRKKDKREIQKLERRQRMIKEKLKDRNRIKEDK